LFNLNQDKLNMVKSIFSIKDLENLSGIKAHTLRIWEKRYNLLKPDRTDSNIRYYNLTNLQKLLNITHLYQNGYKISKIARFEPEEIVSHVNSLSGQNLSKSVAISDFKIAMINFDVNLFKKTYGKLAEKHDFTYIFINIFIPFLSELGLLWQMNTVRPTHEHFITVQIKQLILSHVQKVLGENNSYSESDIFILYLPENEIHDIGISYLYYELLRRGYKAIYMGQSLPLESLNDFNHCFEKVIFISYFTVKPSPAEVQGYLDQFSKEINAENKHKLWLLGRQANQFEGVLPSNVKVFQTIVELIQNI